MELKKNIFLRNSLGGHILRSLIIAVCVGAYAAYIEKSQAREEELRDAVAAIAKSEAARYKHLAMPKRLPTDYRPQEGGLAMLSAAQIQAHQARVERVTARINDVQQATAKPVTLKKSKKKKQAKRPSAKQLRRARALKIYNSTRGQLRKARAGGIRGDF